MNAVVEALDASVLAARSALDVARDAVAGRVEGDGESVFREAMASFYEVLQGVVDDAARYRMADLALTGRLAANFALYALDRAGWARDGVGAAVGAAFTAVEDAMAGEDVGEAIAALSTVFEREFAGRPVSTALFFGMSAEEAEDFGLSGEAAVPTLEVPGVAPRRVAAAAAGVVELEAEPASVAESGAARDGVVEVEPAAVTAGEAVESEAAAVGAGETGGLAVVGEDGEAADAAEVELSAAEMLAPELAAQLALAFGHLKTLREDRSDAAALDGVRRTTHRMAGDAGVMGFDEVRSVLRVCERHVQRLCQGKRRIGDGLLGAVDAVLRWVEGLTGERGVGLDRLDGLRGPALSAALEQAIEGEDEDLRELRGEFATQAGAMLADIRGMLGALQGEPDDVSTFDRLRGEFHTLKGDAVAARAPVLKTLFAHGEEVFERLARTGEVPSVAHLDALLGLVEMAEGRLDGVREGLSEPELGALPSVLVGGAVWSGGVPRADAGRSTEPTVAVEGVAAKVSASPGDRGKAGGKARVMVDAGRLEDASLRVLRSLDVGVELGGVLAEVDELLARVSREVYMLVRLRGEVGSGASMSGLAASKEEAERAELQRNLHIDESVGNLLFLASSLRDAGSRARRAQVVSQELGGGLSQQLLALQMDRLDSVALQLEQVVLRTARGVGKTVDWRMEVGDIALARDVVEAIVKALKHMLRNAIDHGIESAEERLAAGKPEVGSVRLEAHLGGSGMAEIALVDDGRGLNTARLREKAVSTGLLSAEAAATLSEAEAGNLIWESGLSTARQVTDFSGRGVGMGVVRDVVVNLGGRVRVESAAGQGTRMVLEVPVERSVREVLVLRCGSVRFGVPVAGLRRLHHDDGSVRFERVVWPGGVSAGMASLVVEMEGARGSVAYAADEVLACVEGVVRPLPSYMRGRGLQGGVVDASGGVVVVYDPLQWEACAMRVSGAADLGSGRGAKVLIVDDSVIVRRKLESDLRRLGYETAGAGSGEEALRWIGANGMPDLVTLDLEMDDMSGLALLSVIRGTRGGADLPAVVISTLPPDQYAEEAERLGVAACLAKPFAEGRLEAVVRELAPLGAA